MKKILPVLFVIVYASALLWLSSTWYNTYISFHFFDDFLEWKYLDKMGHFFTSFYIGLAAFTSFGHPADLNSAAKKRWICFAGFVFLFPIEVLDGFSMNYGASIFDLIANLLGGVFCFYYVSNKTVSSFHPKFSFHNTAFAILRPDMLGATFAQQVVKDYNGQTYWLSVDINSIVNKKIIPNWLMLTIGYGAEGLLGGHDNVWQNAEGKTFDYSNVARVKRFFISVDLNTGVLRNKNRLFNYLLAPFVILKFPSPAIEINAERGVIFHWIYF
ncbi:MAG TPA: hypothetical protein VL728_06255 [Cyclobacteriaceae bacterium]|jgi:hypothetical protein|nr:hypothetical protein [Cyclobacteriaceae bacterium]